MAGFWGGCADTGIRSNAAERSGRTRLNLNFIVEEVFNDGLNLRILPPTAKSGFFDEPAETGRNSYL